MKDTYNPVAVIADNLSRLMKHEKEKGRSLWTAEAVAKKAEVGHGTVDRAQKGQTNINVANLQAIAKAFGLRAWQLMVPDLEPDNPPVLQSRSAAEDALYKQLRDLAKQLPNDD